MFTGSQAAQQAIGEGDRCLLLRSGGEGVDDGTGHIVRIESPKIAYVDFDMALFKAAYAAEDTVYRFVKANGEVVKEFPSASSSKQWLEEVSIFGICPETSYSGSGDDLTREVCYTLHDAKKAYKAFDNLVEEHKGA